MTKDTIRIEQREIKGKIRIEQEEIRGFQVIKVSAKEGNWLFGYEDVPFEITYYQELQREKACDVHGSLNDMPFLMEYDTEVKCEDSRDYRKRSYWYKEGKFSGRSAINLGYARQSIKHLDYVEPFPLRYAVITKYEPLLSVLERIVSKQIIER